MDTKDLTQMCRAVVKNATMSDEQRAKMLALINADTPEGDRIRQEMVALVDAVIDRHQTRIQ